MADGVQRTASCEASLAIGVHRAKSRLSDGRPRRPFHLAVIKSKVKLGIVGNDQVSGVEERFDRLGVYIEIILISEDPIGIAVHRFSARVALLAWIENEMQICQ